MLLRLTGQKPDQPSERDGSMGCDLKYSPEKDMDYWRGALRIVCYPECFLVHLKRRNLKDKKQKNPTILL
jgi:hypothetical protein